MRFVSFHLIEVILGKKNIERDKLLSDRIGFVTSYESDKLFITFLIFFIIDRYVLLKFFNNQTFSPTYFDNDVYV